MYSLFVAAHIFELLCSNDYDGAVKNCYVLKVTALPQCDNIVARNNSYFGRFIETLLCGHRVVANQI